jgi:ribonuclease-3 family protein
MLLDTERKSREDAKRENPVALAYLGDAVFTLYVRARLVKNGNAKPSDLQRTSAKIVSARWQSEWLETLLPRLTEEEMEVFRRGRNAKKPTKSKSASAGEYNRSTGLEAVLGFLYLAGDESRVKELLSGIDESAFEVEKGATAFKP